MAQSLLRKIYESLSDTFSSSDTRELMGVYAYAGFGGAIPFATLFALGGMPYVALAMVAFSTGTLVFVSTASLALENLYYDLKEPKIPTDCFARSTTAANEAVPLRMKPRLMDRICKVANIFNNKSSLATTTDATQSAPSKIAKASLAL